jgi:hypothetical protein
MNNSSTEAHQDEIKVFVETYWDMFRGTFPSDKRLYLSDVRMPVSSGDTAQSNRSAHNLTDAMLSMAVPLMYRVQCSWQSCIKNYSKRVQHLYCLQMCGENQRDWSCVLGDRQSLAKQTVVSRIRARIPVLLPWYDKTAFFVVTRLCRGLFLRAESWRRLCLLDWLDCWCQELTFTETMLVASYSEVRS